MPSALVGAHHNGKRGPDIGVGAVVVERRSNFFGTPLEEHGSKEHSSNVTLLESIYEHKWKLASR